MPNLALDFNTFFRGVIVLNSTSARQGRSEKFLMAADNWSDAAAQLALLARLRASLLGRDAEVSYAAIAQWGPGRDAEAVITDPITGGLGVKWDEGLYVEESANCNNPGASLRLRQETGSRKHIMRHLVCVPDALINRSKYTGETVPDALALGTYAATATVGSMTALLPTQTLWTIGDPVAGVTTHKTWQDMAKLYFVAIHQFTWWGKLTIAGVAPSRTYTALGEAWSKLLYRGVGRVRMGSPILR